ncbi:MAG TPA: hypothetical protein VND87_12605 [Stellaceae bacterium]|nr:hypothetical protein [Stellaceae bacterium]
MAKALTSAALSGAAALMIATVSLPSSATASGCLWDVHSWSCVPLPAHMASAVRPQPRAGVVLATAFRLAIHGVSR